MIYLLSLISFCNQYIGRLTRVALKLFIFGLTLLYLLLYFFMQKHFSDDADEYLAKKFARRNFFLTYNRGDPYVKKEFRRVRV